MSPRPTEPAGRHWEAANASSQFVSKPPVWRHGALLLVWATALRLSLPSAHATSVYLAFDNTRPATSGGVFGPSAHQVGNQITLAGEARQITHVSWMVYSQNHDVLAQIETHIYSNDGEGGAPGTLLWSSGLLTGVNVSATATLLDVAVPNITVPTQITVTSRIYDAVPVALGRVFGGPPTVGSLQASWVETSPGQWQQWSGPWGMQIIAVPEPSAVALATVSLVGLMGFLRGRVSRHEQRART